ncbi:E3 ubiquitin-protein ligase PRT6 [Linum grandiflorum]
MDVDLPPDPTTLTNRIVQKLSNYGVPNECLERLGEGLVEFVADKRPDLRNLVSAILPTDEEVAEISRIPHVEVKATLRNRFKECKPWLLWLMFSGDPEMSLNNLSRLSAGRGVCGAVWGTNDIAYRCRTCEHDPTCAICVPCFQNGDHKDHDYSIIYTGGGCCDCGDATAWKREGFCSKHKGAEQIQSLPLEYAISVEPVLDVLLQFWKHNLIAVRSRSQESARDYLAGFKEYATELTIFIVEMLLEFCKYSESLLSFVSKRVTALDGLLEVLVRSESSLGQKVARKLHELLLKLLGEPTFKYEFAKVFLGYYPFVVNEVIREGSDAALKKYPLLLKFSVQIFTVPTLTPRLVKEMDLLSILLRCLGDIFSHCAGEDGSLQGSKLGNLYEIAARVVDDIRFVMSHSVVPKYITYDRRDILRTWMKLLSFLQGMSSLKRETGIHVEEDSADNASLPFSLGHPVAEIHSLLVDGAFACKDGDDEELFWKMDTHDVDEGDGLRHAKVGRLSEESSVSGATGRSSTFSFDTKLGDVKSDSGFHSLIPSAVTWLAHECLRAIENWLEADNISGSISSQNTSNIADSKFGALKRTISKINRGNYVFGRISSDDSIRYSALPTNSVMTANFEDARGTSLNCIERPDDSPAEVSGSTEFNALRILSSPEWPNIVFDVSSQHVSVHIYLHRLLALLLKRSLTRSFGESDVDLMVSTVHKDFFGCVLRGYHPSGFSAYVMEHPLRNRVFCAQVLAGMWKKNGDAAILSCEWYRSVRWSEQGLELDLFLLQCCAALAPADLYVDRIIKRFGLSDYFSLKSVKSNKFEPVLVQAMLTLIIQIVQERHFSGLTTAENLKRELVRRLAIGDATHSQLVKSLPPDLAKSGQLQEIIEAVAVYSNPSGFNQGTYSLRPSFWKELDLYHPRWNSRELQVAEERYMRFCNVPALTTQLPGWKNIYLPLQGVARVATCTAVLQVIRAVLFHAVFSDKIKDKRAPDGVLLATLHLLSLSLDACCQQKELKDLSFQLGDSAPIVKRSVEVISDSLHYDAGQQSLISLLVSLMSMHKRENFNNCLEADSCDISSLIERILKRFAEIDCGCMTLLQQLAPEVVVQLSRSAHDDTDMPKFVSDSEKRKALARERQAAVMAKMKAEQSKFLSCMNSATHDDSESEQEESRSDDENEFKDLAQDVCSLCHDSESKDPLSYLVLLQKSRLLSIIDRGPPSWDKGAQSDKEHLSGTKKVAGQSGVISFSGSASSQFLKIVQNVVNESAGYGKLGEVNTIFKILKARFPSLKFAEVPCTSKDGNDQNIYTVEQLEDNLYSSIRKEMNDFVVHSESGMGSDHFQADGSNLNDNMITDSVFLGKYVAALSTEMIQQPSASASAARGEMQAESTSEPSSYDGFGPEGCDGIHLSSCGHAVHQACLDRYLLSLKERYTRRNVVEGAHIVNPDQGEFLCPVCRRLANSVLYSFPGNFEKDRKPVISTASSSRSSSPFISSDDKRDAFLLNKGFSLMKSAARVVRNGNILRTVPAQKEKRTGPNLDSFSKMLSGLYFGMRHENFLESSAVNEFMVMWDTLKYSLISMEISARAGDSSTTPTYSLDSLYKELNSSSGFTLSKLLKIVQFMRTSNVLHVLQRYRGTQLFGDSICLETSKECRDKAKSHQGDLLWEQLDKVLFPDVQFWNRAADPVITHDAFSSFMWVIFCLPQPFLSCEDSMLSLVHVFYSVTILQAIITYCGNEEYKYDDFPFSDSLITDIISVVRESGSSQRHFVSNYLDRSCDITVSIRRLSFPFLRRCALLWKLLRTSVSAPFCSRNETPYHSMDGVDMEIDLVELNEVEKLEKMFKIPPLNIILRDHGLRDKAMKWYHHFREVSGTESFHGTLYMTPVVPFKLMQLPHVYHDLPQRYIKQSCVHCKTVIDEPALCLLCGRLCSLNWKPCCSESGCQTHAKTCGAGTGVFLLVKKTTILLQRCARQAPWHSPYLDAFGEEDIEMHRGKPLYLNEERYAALCHMVASHGLDRSSRVLGQTTIGNFFLL